MTSDERLERISRAFAFVPLGLYDEVTKLAENALGEILRESEEVKTVLREIAEDYHCVVVEPDPDAGQHLEGCVGCFATDALAKFEGGK